MKSPVVSDADPRLRMWYLSMLRGCQRDTVADLVVNAVIENA
jgi:hypothetical protein